MSFIWNQLHRKPLPATNLNGVPIENNRPRKCFSIHLCTLLYTHNDVVILFSKICLSVFQCLFVDWRVRASIKSLSLFCYVCLRMAGQAPIECAHILAQCCHTALKLISAPMRIEQQRNNNKQPNWNWIRLVFGIHRLMCLEHVLL